MSVSLGFCTFRTCFPFRVWFLHFMVLVSFRGFAVRLCVFPTSTSSVCALLQGFWRFVSQVGWLVLCGRALKCPIFVVTFSGRRREGGGGRAGIITFMSSISSSPNPKPRQCKPKTSKHLPKHLKTASPKSCSSASPKPCFPLKPNSPKPQTQTVQAQSLVPP